MPRPRRLADIRLCSIDWNSTEFVKRAAAVPMATFSDMELRAEVKTGRFVKRLNLVCMCRIAKGRRRRAGACA